MAKLPAKKTVRKRPTRAQLDERLAIPLGRNETVKAMPNVEPVDPAARQRARDRAGD